MTELSGVGKLSRRSIVGAGSVAAASVLFSPIYVRNAFSSSGELNLLGWSDQFPDPIIRGFEEATGIRVNLLPFSQNEEQVYKLRSSAAVSYDLCQPAWSRVGQFKELKVLAPFDRAKLPNTSGIIPSILRGSETYWTWDGELYHIPHCWSSEAICYRRDLIPQASNEVSFSNLWAEDVKGRVQGKLHSMLLGIGLWWDATGKQPSNRMLDGYVSSDEFRRLWDPVLAFAVEHKQWIRQFWDTSEDIRSGFEANEVSIAQALDRPSFALKDVGMPLTFRAPREGALVWVDGLSLTKGATNIEQAYEFLNYLMTPQVAAHLADASGLNPVVLGAEEFTTPTFRGNFQEAYSGGHLDNLWLWPPEPEWYKELRSEYLAKFAAT